MTSENQVHKKRNVNNKLKSKFLIGLQNLEPLAEPVVVTQPYL